MSILISITYQHLIVYVAVIMHSSVFSFKKTRTRNRRKACFKTLLFFLINEKLGLWTVLGTAFKVASGLTIITTISHFYPDNLPRLTFHCAIRALFYKDTLKPIRNSPRFIAHYQTLISFSHHSLCKWIKMRIII